MSRIILANKLKERYFTIEYFFGQNIFIGTLRLFGAPIMIILGVWFFFSEIQNVVLYGWVLIIYALYFGLRPWFIIYFKRKNFETSMFEIHIDNNSLTISDKDAENKFDFTDIKAINERKEYFVVKYRSNKELYLPKKQLNESEIEILTKRTS